MSAAKRTVYLSEQALALVRPGESLSGRLNDICQRYAVLRQHLPTLIAEFDGESGGDGLRLLPWADIEACRKAIED